MSAPLSKLTFLAAVIVLLASIFQKQLAEKIQTPMKEPTMWEKVLGGAKQVVDASKGEASIFTVPEHPVAKSIFWAAIAIAGVALFAWILEDVFWLPLLAMCLALSAVVLKAAWLPALVALLKTTPVSGQRRKSTASSSTSRRTTSSRSRSRSAD